jgi:hypothetical protein
MGKLVKIELEVTAEAAEALSDEARRKRLGDFVSRMMRPDGTEDDPLVQVFRETQKAAEDAGLTAEEVEAELAAYNAERRR